MSLPRTLFTLNPNSKSLPCHGRLECATTREILLLLIITLVTTEAGGAKVIAVPSATNGSASHSTVIFTAVIAIGSLAAVVRNRSLQVNDDRVGQVVGFVVAEERCFVGIEVLVAPQLVSVHMYT